MNAVYASLTASGILYRRNAGLELLLVGDDPVG